MAERKVEREKSEARAQATKSGLWPIWFEQRSKEVQVEALSNVECRKFNLDFVEFNALAESFKLSDFKGEVKCQCGCM
jgi:hypothetical protein